MKDKTRRVRKPALKGGVIPTAKNLYANGKSVEFNSGNWTTGHYHMDPNSKKSVVRSLGGITGVRLHSKKNNHNSKWVVKNGRGFTDNGWEAMQDEYAASSIYKAVNIPVPEQRLDIEGQVLISEYLLGTTIGQLQYVNSDMFEEAKKQAQKGFIMDVLLGNYDVYGSTDGGNMIFSNNVLYRIDNGCTFDRNASGKPRWKFVFHGNIIEQLDEFRDVKRRDPASQGTRELFSDIPDEEIVRQIKTLVIPNKEIIIRLTPDRKEMKMERGNNRSNNSLKNLRQIMAERIASLEEYANRVE